MPQSAMQGTKSEKNIADKMQYQKIATNYLNQQQTLSRNNIASAMQYIIDDDRKQHTASQHVVGTAATRTGFLGNNNNNSNNNGNNNNSGNNGNS
jgi:hypothetical protein